MANTKCWSERADTVPAPESVNDTIPVWSPETLPEFSIPTPPPSMRPDSDYAKSILTSEAKSWIRAEFEKLDQIASGRSGSHDVTVRPQ